LLLLTAAGLEITTILQTSPAVPKTASARLNDHAVLSSMEKPPEAQGIRPPQESIDGHASSPSLHPRTLSTPSAPLYKDVPDLETFKLNVWSGNPDQVTGIWVEGVLAFTVEEGHGNYVPSRPFTASTYEWGIDHGVTALLIHNHLGGTRLYDLETGTRIAVVSGTGEINWYRASGGTWYEADQFSMEGFAGPFRTWTCTNCAFSLSVNDLRWRHYAGPHHLAIQTCVQIDDRVGLVIYEAHYLGPE
jgi:hypothetical protein